MRFFDHVLYHPKVRKLLSALSWLVVLGVGLAVGSWLAGQLAPPPAPPPQPAAPRPEPTELLAKARQFYASRPLYEQPHDFSKVPEGMPDLRSRTCGVCHVEIYEEWMSSTHRRAWLDDAQFQEELAKSRGDHAPQGEVAPDVSWMCVNCHTPMMNQLEQLVVGLDGGDIGKPQYVDNPYFDAVMQLDAIGCASCHVRDGVIYGPYGDTKAPHPTAKGDFLLSEQACTRCHQAEAQYPLQNLGCFFSTGREWQASSFPAKGQNCQSCHMPEVTRKVAEGFDVPERKGRRHWFGGSLIPKHPRFEQEIAPLRAIFGSGVTLNLLSRPQAERKRTPGTRSPHSIDPVGLAPCEGKKPCTRLVIRIHNDRAGHGMPTGDPERHLDIKALARSPKGAVLARADVRIGSLYEWWPAIRKVKDNRLMPGEYLDMALDVPASGAFEIELVAEKYRMHKNAFEHHNLLGRYVRGRRFHRSLWNVEPGGRIRQLALEDDLNPAPSEEP